MTQKLWSYKIKVYSTLLMQLWMCLEWFQFYGGEHFQHVLEVQTVEVVPSYVTCAHSDLVRKTPWLSTVLQSTSVDNRLLVLFRRQETIPICLLGWYLAELHASTSPPPPQCSTVGPLFHATSTGEMWKGPNLPTFLTITFRDISKFNPLSITFSIPT